MINSEQITWNNDSNILIKDSWKNQDGSINYESHYASVKIAVKDSNNCYQVIDRYCLDPDCWESVKTKPQGKEGIDYNITYREECGTKLVDGLDLEKRVGGMEGMIYELKTENTILKESICQLDNCNLKFEWCGCLEL